MALVQKLRHMRLAVSQNGGLVGSFLTLFRTDELKWGDFIGADQDGNKYYQNKVYPIGRSRWVIYSNKYGYDYDGSQVPAEWHRWLSYISDDPPTLVPPVERKWMINHKENFSGTSKQYVPYSTVPPKVEAWKPPSS